MLEAQDGHCYLCPSTEDLEVDHDHKCCPRRKKTCGKCVRKILCHACNIRIAPFDYADSDWVIAAIDYVLEHIR